MGQICEMCVHFRQKVRNFAYRGIFGHRIQNLPDPRGSASGSAAILNFQNGHLEKRLKVTFITSEAVTSVEFGILWYFCVPSYKIANSKRFDQWVGRHLEFSIWPPRKEIESHFHKF